MIAKNQILNLLRILLFTGPVAGLLTSCSDAGQAIEQQRFANLQIRAMTVDSLLLQVQVDETPLIHELATPGTALFQEVKYLNPTHRFRVTDLYSHTRMLDTLIDYKPAGAFTYITFFQPGTGANLVVVGPPASEPVPPDGQIKVSVVYRLDNMPDQVKVVVMNSKSGTSSSDYEQSDSFLLKKGEFSPYFLSWASTSRKPMLQIFTTDATPALIATVGTSAFSVPNGDFDVYSFDRISGTGANRAISLVKLY